MFTKTTIALAAALIAGSASAVLASDHEDQHWDSQKEMARLENVQRPQPIARTLAGNAYAFGNPTRKPASLRVSARANCHEVERKAAAPEPWDVKLIGQP
jgi:hypothetical protein